MSPIPRMASACTLRLAAIARTGQMPFKASSPDMGFELGAMPTLFSGIGDGCFEFGLTIRRVQFLGVNLKPPRLRGTVIPRSLRQRRHFV